MHRWLYAFATVITGISVVFAATAAMTASADAAQAGFAARAHAAGLADAQIRGLQQEVSGFIGRYGGTQVAINKVAFRGGSLLFAVPGHNAREVANVSAGATVETADTSSCPLGDFCEWDQSAYIGNRAEFYVCTRYDQPFSGFGSWKNDQTPQDGTGPGVKMYYANGTVYTTPPPWCANKVFNWQGVTAIRPC